MRDGSTLLKFSEGYQPASQSDDTAIISTVVDTANFDTCTFLIQLGTIDDSNATFVILVEDDDAAGFGTGASVADAYLIGTEAGAAFLFSDDGNTAKIGYIGPKRYVRVTITPNGNGSPFLMGATWVQGHAKKGPQTTQIV